MKLGELLFTELGPSQHRYIFTRQELQNAAAYHSHRYSCHVVSKRLFGIPSSQGY